MLRTSSSAVAAGAVSSARPQVGVLDLLGTLVGRHESGGENVEINNVTL